MRSLSKSAATSSRKLSSQWTTRIRVSIKHWMNRIESSATIVNNTPRNCQKVKAIDRIEMSCQIKQPQPRHQIELAGLNDKEVIKRRGHQCPLYRPIYTLTISTQKNPRWAKTSKRPQGLSSQQKKQIETIKATAKQSPRDNWIK